MRGIQKIGKVKRLGLRSDEYEYENKLLTIRFKNYTVSESLPFQTFTINLEVTTKNLSTTKALIYLLKENERFPITSVPAQSRTITTNGTTSLNISFTRNKNNFAKDNQNTIYSALIVCDGLTSETSQFNINSEGIQNVCFCSRNFSVKEFKNIVVELRKENGYRKLAEVLFDENRDEKIQNATFEDFTKNINAVFSKYEVNTCIRKIHFLAQAFHESLHFRVTYEGLNTVPDNYGGGVDFQGKGIGQLTHDYNYLEYYDYVMGASFYKDRYQGRNKTGESVTKFANRTNDTILLDVIEELKIFSKRLSEEMNSACDSAGWYWWHNKINEFADKDDIINVSAKINNPSAKNTTSSKNINGYKERNKYTNDLKEIMNYEKCINNYK